MKQISPPTRPLISDRYKPIVVYLNETPAHVTIDHLLYIPLGQGQSLWGEGLE